MHLNALVKSFLSHIFTLSLLFSSDHTHVTILSILYFGLLSIMIYYTHVNSFINSTCILIMIVIQVIVSPFGDFSTAIFNWFDSQIKVSIHSFT